MAAAGEADRKNTIQVPSAMSRGRRRTPRFIFVFFF
jgi:hypothetical protein